MIDLPPFVRPVRDRHGKTRYRFRRVGYASGYINHAPDTPDFMRRYAELLEGKVEPASIKSRRAYKDRSIDHLAALYRARPKWHRQAMTTQTVYNGIIERFCNTVGKSGLRYGERPVAKITVAWLDSVLGRMADRPQAANQLRKTVRAMLNYAIKMRWVASNAADLTDAYPSGKGYHCWTDDEIAQYRAHHAYGTTARLVMELALNAAARRCNVAIIERDHIKGGKIAITHAKGGEATLVPMSAETRAAIDAMPVAPIRYLVVTSFGKPYTRAGLGNAFRDWRNEAGLPEHCTMHGLRKAQSRRLAESGATDAQGRAVTGHVKDQTFAYYAAAANRTALAEDAMSNLETKDMSNL